MEKLSYDVNEVDESMMNTSNILEDNVRNSYQLIIDGRRGRKKIRRPDPGRFCVAYPLVTGEGKEPELCYRVWKEIIPDAFERYKLIGKGIRDSQLAYFCNFKFIERALRLECDGRIVPGMTMHWIDGSTLEKFFNERWSGLTPSEKATFIRDFYLMCYELRKSGISHGDLSCKNIMVTGNRRLRLVDYDSLYVSQMGNRYNQVTGGAEGFQHPERLRPATRLKAGLDDDNFSQIVIALSMWVAYFEPSVASRFDDSNLLFYNFDFEGDTPAARLSKLHNSFGWKTASKYKSDFKHIGELMTALESVARPLNSVPSILSFLTEETLYSPQFFSILKGKSIQPSVVGVDYCTHCGRKFMSEAFNYCSACGHKRHNYWVNRV